MDSYHIILVVRKRQGMKVFGKVGKNKKSKYSERCLITIHMGAAEVELTEEDIIAYDEVW